MKDSHLASIGTNIQGRTIILMTNSPVGTHLLLSGRSEVSQQVSPLQQPVHWYLKLLLSFSFSSCRPTGYLLQRN